MASPVLLSEIFPPRHGGSGRWFWEAYRRLSIGDLRVLAGTCSGHREFDATHSLRIQRLDLAFQETGTFSWRGLSSYWKVVEKLRALHLQQPIEMLHCGRCITEGWAGWMFQRLTGVPYLCYVHGEDVNKAASPSAFGVMSSRQHRWMAGWVLRDAALLIANSNNSRTILEKQWGINATRIRVIHPGVDTDLFVPAARCASTRSKLEWFNRPVILTVGRLQQRKGHDQLIRSLVSVRAQIPDVLYVIAGNGNELAMLQQLVGDLGLQEAVQFRTNVDDRELIQLYQQCDVFALPNRAVGSDVEGFGMVLLEAQACGKPVIAGESGGTREAMDAPRTGFVIPCEGGPELAKAVVQLLSSTAQREAMGSAGHDWVNRHFAWNAIVQRMQSAFRDAMNSAPAPRSLHTESNCATARRDVANV